MTLGKSSVTKQLSFRLNHSEVPALERAAQSMGLSVSEYLRFLCRLRPMVESYDPEAGIGPLENATALPIFSRGEIMALVAEHRRQGGNLNQIARALNDIAADPDDMRFTHMERTVRLAREELEVLNEHYSRIEDMLDRLVPRAVG